MNLLLIGYRGTGKTSVGRRLGELLDMPVIDADVELERRAGRTIREIFSRDGEPVFRQLEAELLADLLASGHRILSLGGGVVLKPENRALIKNASDRRVVWLNAGAPAIHARLTTDATTSERRPALTNLNGLEEIETLLAAREPYYAECADYRIETEGKSVEQIATEIVSLVK